MQYKIGDMVFAKCQSYPYWPGKVIACLPVQGTYKILFYGQKSEATINENFMMPYNQEIQRKVYNQGNNRHNKDLRNSMNIASKRYQKRKKGLASSSEEEDFFQESEPTKRVEVQEIQKSKKTFSFKVPEDPHLELGHLLNLLSEQAALFSQAKQKAVKFTVQNEIRLRELLDPQSGLSLVTLIENKIIQKFIVVLKQLDYWHIKGFEQLHQLVRKRYQQYKAIIQSQQFYAYPLRELKRQIIIQKVKEDKAVL